METTTLEQLKKQLDDVYAEMPTNHFEMEQRNKSVFLISREIEKLEGLAERLEDAEDQMSRLREQNSTLQGQITQMKSSILEKVETQLTGLKELQHQLANSIELK